MLYHSRDSTSQNLPHDLPQSLMNLNMTELRRQVLLQKEDSSFVQGQCSNFFIKLNSARKWSKSLLALLLTQSGQNKTRKMHCRFQNTGQNKTSKKCIADFKIRVKTRQEKCIADFKIHTCPTSKPIHKGNRMGGIVHAQEKFLVLI